MAAMCDGRARAEYDSAQRRIARALAADEAGRRVEAITLYHQALQDVQARMRVLSSMRGAGEFSEKLLRNSSLLTERISELEDKERTSKAQAASLPSGSPRISSAPPARSTSSDGRSASVGAAGGRLSSASAAAPRLEHLAGVEEKHLRIIMDEIIDKAPAVSFADVVGLDGAKEALKEIVILPSLRPELFTGLRSPARGVLLFGPPGNGKTMLAKAVAQEAQARFFNISASSLTSKWLGESEKLMRALFAVARHVQPAVIFIDEIDSLLTQRSTGEHEASRRLKTEFLVQFDGVASGAEDRVLVLGATNMPDELDDAALRRFVKRIYVPMPDAPMRARLLASLVAKVPSNLNDGDIGEIVRRTVGYSCSDLTGLAREAAMAPLRDLGDRVRSVRKEDVRAVTRRDFLEALTRIRPSVPEEKMRTFEDWNERYGYRA